MCQIDDAETEVEYVDALSLETVGIIAFLFAMGVAILAGSSVYPSRGDDFAFSVGMGAGLVVGPLVFMIVYKLR